MRKMYAAHIYTLSFKDLWTQVPICDSIFACTSDQFLSLRSGPNYIKRIQIGPSLQRKVPGRWTLLIQEPKPQTFAFFSIDLTPLPTRTSQVPAVLQLCLRGGTQKLVTSSVYADTIASRQPVNEIPRWTGRFFPPSSHESGAPKRGHREVEIGSNRAGWTVQSRSTPCASCSVVSLP